MVANFGNIRLVFNTTILYNTELKNIERCIQNQVTFKNNTLLFLRVDPCLERYAAQSDESTI